MIRRTIEISRRPCHLSVRHGQLVLRPKQHGTGGRSATHDDLLGRVPLEDLGVLVVDERETTYSHAALVGLAENGGVLVVCGRDHLPCSLLLPMTHRADLRDRLDVQLDATKPRRKRIWADLVVAKIRGQAANLPTGHAARRRIETLARAVRSGDPENLEAQAAQVYWPIVFESAAAVADPFRRRPGRHGAPPPNALLDYGYAIMRAAVARAIVSAGLHPAIGIMHRRRDNPFCLADDLVEPLRPLVDARVLGLAESARFDLDQAVKAELLRLLTVSVTFENRAGPLQVVLARYVAAFVRALGGEARRMSPAPIPAGGTDIRRGVLAGRSDEEDIAEDGT